MEVKNKFRKHGIELDDGGKIFRKKISRPKKVRRRADFRGAGVSLVLTQKDKRDASATVIHGSALR